MPKICYKDKRFKKETLELIRQANKIIIEYQYQGFQLTLRQLYYQFVARDLIANTDKMYKKLASTISDARLAGLIDWKAIIDRTRNMKSNSHWNSPGEIVEICSKQYQIDKWEGQPIRPEVWIEKDALIGVIEDVCKRLDVSYFSCRGYTSQSEMWSAAQRLIGYYDNGQEVKILHLGDHDPSGIDMSRDIEERLNLFMSLDDYHIDFERLALNRDQIDDFNPPPNPAKVTDPRAGDYIAKHGTVSWELDSLEPSVMAELIEDAILDVRHETLWQEAIEKEDEDKQKLSEVSNSIDE